ncbi:MAG TPA: hypothetical protein VF468_04775 [Actinomycetota bacterium]|nr:hypothetical protein [Actinomycetota bacterium]
MNPPVTDPLDPITEPQPACPCHHATDRPDEATVTVGAAELTRLGELLTDIDEFLRCCGGLAELLAGVHAHRGHPHPRSAAATLVDDVGFTALGLRLDPDHPTPGGGQ